MNRITIPINEIKVISRQRQDYGDLEELAQSLDRYGLIQPIVINQDKRLIAGGRRLQAATDLGWTSIDCVYRETMSDDELHELELEENVRRKEMDWKEKTLTILNIHRLKKKRSALEGSLWGTRETAEMLGIKGHSNVHYAVRVGEYLEKKDEEITNCTSMLDAWKVVMRRNEEDGMAELAKPVTMVVEGEETNGEVVIDAKASAFDLSDFSTPLADTISVDDKQHILALRERGRGVGYLDLNEQEARTLYLSNPLNPPDDFLSYYNNRRASCSKIEQDRLTIPLSKMLLHVNSIDYMKRSTSSEQFDAIITDIPYGIDMDMLNQQHPEGGMNDIVTVKDEHTVEGNEELFRQFFPAAFHCLKPNSYLITWCDQWQWKYMADLAILSGFKVQRWPITWVKSHPCMNQSANTNFTKTTEIALVCRKGVATLSRANIPCHIEASHDDLKDKLGHPFVKPFAVWEHLINAVTIKGQLILEPFVGRGSAFISATILERRMIGCELDDAHYNALLENVKQHYLSISPNFIFT